MRTQLLIVGGGLVGLTASLLAGQHGFRAVLVEKHATTSPQPKARRFNTRTSPDTGWPRRAGYRPAVPCWSGRTPWSRGDRTGRSMIRSRC